MEKNSWSSQDPIASTTINDRSLMTPCQAESDQQPWEWPSDLTDSKCR